MVTPQLKLRSAGLFQSLSQLFGRARFGALKWKEPVKVRMLESFHEPAGLATATRLRTSLFAKEHLREPETQAFLPDTGRTVEEDRLGK
jgi:hypothetical protein